MRVPDEVAQLIASRVKANIREIEGCQQDAGLQKNLDVLTRRLAP